MDQKEFTMVLDGAFDECQMQDLLFGTVPNAVASLGGHVVSLKLKEQEKEQALKVPAPGFFERR